LFSSKIVGRAPHQYVLYHPIIVIVTNTWGDLAEHFYQCLVGCDAEVIADEIAERFKKLCDVKESLNLQSDAIPSRLDLIDPFREPSHAELENAARLLLEQRRKLIKMNGELLEWSDDVVPYLAADVRNFRELDVKLDFVYGKVSARRDSQKVCHFVTLVGLPPSAATFYASKGLVVAKRLVVATPPKS